MISLLFQTSITPKGPTMSLQQMFKFCRLFRHEVERAF